MRRAIKGEGSWKFMGCFFVFFQNSRSDQEWDLSDYPSSQILRCDWKVLRMNFLIFRMKKLKFKWRPKNSNAHNWVSYIMKVMMSRHLDKSVKCIHSKTQNCTNAVPAIPWPPWTAMAILTRLYSFVWYFLAS